MSADRSSHLGQFDMSCSGESQAEALMREVYRYRLTIGHPLEGEQREYKTLTGARQVGRQLRARGQNVTLWEGTLRGWGGWSWSSIDLDPAGAKELPRTGIKRKGRG